MSNLLTRWEQEIKSQIDANIVRDQAQFTQFVNSLSQKQPDLSKNEYTPYKTFTFDTAVDLGGFDLKAVVNWLATVTKELAGWKGISFGIKQFAMHATREMGQGKIWNPLSFALNAMPLLRGTDVIKHHIDRYFVDPPTKIIDGENKFSQKLLDYRAGTYSDWKLTTSFPFISHEEGPKPSPAQEIEINNTFTENSLYGEKISDEYEKLSKAKTIKEIESIKKLFIGNRRIALQVYAEYSTAATKMSKHMSSIYANDEEKAKTSAIVGEGWKFSDRRKEEKYINEDISKDQIIPFYIYDLRQDTDKFHNFIVFQAYFKTLPIQTFAPAWNTEDYYGRIDTVPIYKSTARTMTLDFTIYPFTEEELIHMWEYKINTLLSMVYPQFSVSAENKQGSFKISTGIIKEAPIIKLRVGNYITSTNNKYLGLPGYITSLSITPGTLWEINEGSQYPKWADVNISFTALHELNNGYLGQDQNGNITKWFGAVS